MKTILIQAMALKKLHSKSNIPPCSTRLSINSLPPNAKRSSISRCVTKRSPRPRKLPGDQLDRYGSTGTAH